MSEQTPETPAATPPEGEQEPTTFDADYVRSLRAEAAKYRTEAKANADAAKRLAEFEESQKSEQQKVAERAEAAERRAVEAESRALRLQIAADKGLTPKQAARLRGSSEEELSADADELLAEFGGNGPRRPAGDIGQGARTNPAVPDDPKSLADAVIAQRGH